MTDLPSLWSSVVSAASRNPEVSVPSPRKWTDTRLRQARKIDSYLDGDWAPLVEAVASATTWGAPCRLDLSLERLTSKDCERLDSLLSGKWRREESRAKVAERSQEERDREKLQQIQEAKADAVEDHHSLLASLRARGDLR